MALLIIVLLLILIGTTYLQIGKSVEVQSAIEFRGFMLSGIAAALYIVIMSIFMTESRSKKKDLILPAMAKKREQEELIKAINRDIQLAHGKGTGVQDLARDLYEGNR